MNPIFEQGEGHGIGYTIPDFLDRFAAICAEHVKTGRAKAFAFILYDFADGAVRTVLRDRDGFTELDRLSGEDLSVFYLHDTKQSYVPEFNAKFLKLLGVDGEARTPCVVFFRMEKKQVIGTFVANLDSRNLVTSFHELYAVLAALRERAERPPTSVLRVAKSAAKFITVEALGGLIGGGVAGLV